MKASSIKLSIISLIFACSALLLATLPPHLIEEEIVKLKQEEIENNGPLTLEIKGFKLTLGKEQKEGDEVNHTSKITKLNKYLKVSQILMFVFVAATVFMSLLALNKEKNKVLTIGSIITACASITWHYVAAGISTAVAVFILILLIANFGV